MRRMLHCLTLAVVVAAQAGDASCQTMPKDCSVDNRGIQVEHGRVTDILTATCDQMPLTHRLDGWIEYRRDSSRPYRRAGEKETIRDRPDRLGVHLFVTAGRCVPGDYRSAWQATGLSPTEKPFNYVDGDVWPTTLDCTEG